MAVNTAVITPVGSGRVYKTDDGLMKFMFVDIALAASVTYDTTLEVSLKGFNKLYRFGMDDAVAGEIGVGVKIKQVLMLGKFAISAGATGQVRGVWEGLKSFTMRLDVVGNNGNTATTGPKDQVELGAVSTGSPAGHAQAVIFF